MISDHIVALLKNNLITEFSLDGYEDINDHHQFLSLIRNNTSLISLQFSPEISPPEIVSFWEENADVMKTTNVCDVHDYDNASGGYALSESLSEALEKRKEKMIFDDKQPPYVNITTSDDMVEELQSEHFRRVTLTKHVEDPEECEQVIDAIPTSVVHLCVGETMTDNNAPAFAQKIKELKGLIILDLSIMRLGKSGLTAKRLAIIFEALQYQKQFTTLDLSGQYLGTQELLVIAEWLPKTNIQRLKLDFVNFSDTTPEAFHVFCHFIKTSKLNTLLFYRSYFEPDHHACTRQMIAAIKENHCMREVSFAKWGLDGESMQQLANSFHLTHIDVSENGLGMGDELYENIQANTQLAIARQNRDRLILGDGNFSFSKALVEKHPRVAGSTIATEFMDEKELDEAFPDFKENTDTLKAKRVAVEYDVDATQLTHPRYRFFDPATQKRTTRIKRAHFNCPRIRKDRNETWDQNSARNRGLVAGFFKSVSQLQDNGDKASVVLPETKKPTQWPSGDEKSAASDTQFRQGVIYGIYDGAKGAGYRYLGKRKFDHTRFPGYEHRVTGEDDTTEAAAVLREYRFEKASGAIPNSSVRPWIKGSYRNCLPECDTDPDSSDYGDSDAEDTEMKVGSSFK